MIVWTDAFVNLLHLSTAPVMQWCCLFSLNGFKRLKNVGLLMLQFFILLQHIWTERTRTEQQRTVTFLQWIWCNENAPAVLNSNCCAERLCNYTFHLSFGQQRAPKLRKQCALARLDENPTPRSCLTPPRQNVGLNDDSTPTSVCLHVQET